MKQPFVYDTGDDVGRLQALRDVPDDTPIYLTTAIYPLPEELGQIDNIVSIHIKKVKRNPDIKDPLLEVIINLKNLETLILERPILSGKIPDEFYELRNLKHLSIHNNWFTRDALTEDIKNLSRLESLEIRGLYKGKLPDAVGELKQLKRLIVQDTNSYFVGGSDIKVSETIWNLSNLQELRIGPGYLNEPLDANRIVELTNLEVFEFLVPVKHIPDEFWRLPHLHEVALISYEQTVVPSLAETQFTSLVLNMPLQVLPDLPASLEKLQVHSSSLVELSSLKDTVIHDLSLDGRNLNTNLELPSTLETLNLRYLPIKNMPVLPELKKLSITACNQIEALLKLPDSMEFLSIGYCRNLSNLPDGLHLEHLLLTQCDSLTKLPAGLVVDSLVIDFCEQLNELPDDLVVKSYIQLTGLNISDIPEFPEDVKVVIHDDY